MKTSRNILVTGAILMEAIKGGVRMRTTLYEGGKIVSSVPGSRVVAEASGTPEAGQFDDLLTMTKAQSTRKGLTLSDKEALAFGRMATDVLTLGMEAGLHVAVDAGRHGATFYIYEKDALAMKCTLRGDRMGESLMLFEKLAGMVIRANIQNNILNTI